MCWKRSLAISLASAALALAGCGGDEEPAVNTGDPTPAAEFSGGLTHPVISDPVNGGTLKADEQENDLYTTAVVVRGVAEPDARVVVSTGCKDEACQKAVRTAADGAFEAEVSLAVEAEQPRGTIVVGYEDSGESVDSDRVIVTVEPPGVTDLPTEDNNTGTSKKKKSKKKAAPLPTSAPPEATAPPSSTTAPSTSSGATTSARNLVVIGDSLAVGMQPFLQEYLQGWNITVDARVGRPLAEGMRQFDAKPDPSNETVYAFSLFTNDGPTNLTALESAVKRSTTKGCAVWSTIVRPPVGGTSYDGANSRLNGLASNRVKVVQWADQAANNPSWIAGDGVHGTPTGYRNRAALYAAAIKSCSG